jgi:hypothetical protein
VPSEVGERGLVAGLLPVDIEDYPDGDTAADGAGQVLFGGGVGQLVSS